MNPGIHAMRQTDAYSQMIYIRNLSKKAVVIQTTAKVIFLRTRLPCHFRDQ